MGGRGATGEGKGAVGEGGEGREGQDIGGAGADRRGINWDSLVDDVFNEEANMIAASLMIFR